MHVAAEVEGLVHHVVADHRDEHDVARVGIDHPAGDESQHATQDCQHEQHAPREEDDAELARGVDRDVVVGEVLVMLPRVPVVDRAQCKHVDLAMHDVLVHRPFAEVPGDQDRNEQHPFPRRVIEGATQHQMAATPAAYITPIWTRPL